MTIAADASTQIGSDHVCGKCGCSPEANIKWSSIYDRWQAVGVKQIEVVDFDPKLHDALWWFHKPKKSEIYINRNPINDTAKILTRGKVTANDEIYAAFALYATSMGYRCGRSLTDPPLTRVAHDRLIKLGEHHYYYSGQAKRVLPPVWGMDELWQVSEIKDSCWCAYIEAAARMWNNLADEWVALKYPCPYSDSKQLLLF